MWECKFGYSTICLSGFFKIWKFSELSRFKGLRLLYKGRLFWITSVLWLSTVGDKCRDKEKNQGILWWRYDKCFWILTGNAWSAIQLRKVPYKWIIITGLQCKAMLLIVHVGDFWNDSNENCTLWTGFIMLMLSIPHCTRMQSRSCALE